MAFKNKTLNLTFLFVTLAFVALSSVFFFGLHEEVSAQVGGGSTELYGAAWSENIGWISFNYCESEGVNCGPVQYSVSVNDSNGNITGAAWSENIGWLKFGNLSQFPSGQGTKSNNAKIKLSNGEFEGWARFCAGTLAGNCSTMDDSLDGWDGWVSLSGDLHPSPDISGNGGVTYDEVMGKIVGKAWGGDVVGWIDFWDVSFGPPQQFDYELTNPTELPGSPVQVVQGGYSSTSVTRTLLSGDTKDILLIPYNLPLGVIVSVDSNQPCMPTCSSILTITDISGGLPLGVYSFDVRGHVLIESEIRTTEVRFEIVESDPEPTVSCQAENGPFFIPNSPTVTWDAQVINPVENEEFLWEGDDDLTCPDQPSEECQTFDYTYATVGRKLARVSIDEGSNFAECYTTIGVIMQFREI